MAVALLACAALVAVPGARSAGEAAGHAPWGVVDTPNAGVATARYTAVACAAADDCWAAGNTVPGTETFPTMAHWDGDAWGLVPSPQEPGLLVYVSGIACATGDECFAVGLISNAGAFLAGQAQLYVHAFVLQWDGDEWSLDELRFGVANSVLRSVSCGGPGDCWAVGYVSEGFTPRNLLLHWDGHRWQRDEAPGLGTDTLGLASVSCTGPAFCMAVGPAADARYREAAAAKWDGTAWTLTEAPAQHPAAGVAAFQYVDPWLTGVSCLSSTDCWAVGDIDVWVADAFGGESTTTTTLPAVQHWDGNGWTGVDPSSLATLVAPGGASSHLTGVSCVAADDCWAVGHRSAAFDASGIVARDAPDEDFTLHFDGTAWTFGAAIPDPSAAFPADLAAVACASSDLCWAVGQETPADQLHGRIEGWDGTLWAPADAPAAGAVTGNYLHDVDCPAVDDCWAVGMDFYGQLGSTLAQHWDGESWSLVPTPDDGEDRYNALRSVSCAAADDCWAVGSTSTWLGWDVQPLALHWDGAAWAVANPLPLHADQITTPVNGAQPAIYTGLDAGLLGVDCVAADDCWAVGFWDAYAGSPTNFLLGAAVEEKPLFLHWDGAAWTPSPLPPVQMQPLSEAVAIDVACRASDDCWAVGSNFERLQYNFIAGPDQQSMVDHWDGKAWSSVASPNRGDYANALYGVGCAEATCWAVGMWYVEYPYSGTPATEPLMARLLPDGTWAAGDAPAGTATLQGVTCTAADDCWAVGSPPGQTSRTSTTVLHWDGADWGRVGSASRHNNGKATENTLAAVDCADPTHCWAVGNYNLGKPPHMRTMVLASGAQGGSTSSSTSESGTATSSGSSTTTATTTTSTSTSATSTATASPSSGTSTSGSAGGTVRNEAPTVTLGELAGAADLRNDAAHDLPFAGVAADRNGCGRLAGMSARLLAPDDGQAAQDVAFSAEPGDCDAGDATRSFAGTLRLGAGAPPGTYLLEVTADDGELSGSAALAVTLRVPNVLEFSYSSGDGLDFGAFSPGDSDVTTVNWLVVENTDDLAREAWFDITDLTHGDSTVYLVDNLDLQVVTDYEPGAAFAGWTTQPYDSTSASLGSLAPGARLALRLVIGQLPAVLEDGQYGASFAVTEG